MMKRFITSMLGSLAAIWISAILFFALFTLFISAIFSDSFIKRIARAELTDNSVLHIELVGDIKERHTDTEIINRIIGIERSTQGLDDIVTAINVAATDPHIKGIFLECKGCDAGVATLDYIRQSILKFKASNKWVVAYADNMSQGDYFVATAADNVILNPVGLLDIHGLSATTLYFKGLFDKLGVDMQVIKVGTYKSAVEPFTLSAPSDPSRCQQQQILDAMWSDMAEKIASSRHIPVASLSLLCDSLLMTASPETYVAEGLVDNLQYLHEVLSLMKGKAGIKEPDDLNLISPSMYCLAVDAPHSRKNRNRIAVLYAYGDIVDEGSEGIVASEIVPQIYSLTDNDEIDGLILRVNSGGGSAFASEQIWEALERFKKTGRPFYVSMGDYAASGGYYISCGADIIFADPLTLTGSIGIFGLVPCAKELMTKHLGITTATVSTNPQGQLPNLTDPLTPFQKAKLQNAVNRGYETFVSRCAQGRNISIDSVKTIAEGRVWDAVTAQKIGLVDKLGSLDDAIGTMAANLNFRNDYMVEVISADKKLNFNLISLLKGRMSANVIADELGEDQWIFKNLRAIRELTPIQCRMEALIVK